MPSQSYHRRLQTTILLLFTSLLFVLNSAHGQSFNPPGYPSYVGPYVYSVPAVAGQPPVVASSEMAAMQGAIDQMKAHLGAGNCNFSGPLNVGEWYWSNYNSNPVEGVDTSASKQFWYTYSVVTNGVCYPDTSIGSYFTLTRQRLVCHSSTLFFDGKCVGLDYFNYPGRGQGNLGPQCPACGRPINPGTGNMWHVELDFAGSGPASALSLKRIYNSVPYAFGAATQRKFGKRWSNRYDAVLVQKDADPTYGESQCWKRQDNGALICKNPLPPVIPSPAPAAVPAAVSVLRSDGNDYTFNRSGLIYQGDGNINDRLNPIFNTGNTDVIAWDYVLASDESTERFAPDGRLLSITERTGRRQVLTYSDGANNDTSVGRYPIDAPPCASIQTGPVTRTDLPLCVTDNWGRQLQFKHDSAGRVVEMIDPNNRSYAYEYDGATGGCDPTNPASTACTASNLTKVTYPDGTSHAYIYNEASQINGGAACPGYAAPENGRGHLWNVMTGLIDEKGIRYITWTYDCLGRATSSELVGGVEKVKLAYQVWSNTSVDATVTHYFGEPAAPTTTVRKYSSWPVSGVQTNYSIDGPCVECGLIKSRAFDANGNATEVNNFKNLRTLYEYDTARNLEITRTEDVSAYSEKTRKIWTSWHPTFRLPIKIAEAKRTTTFTYDGSGNLLTRSVQATSDANGFSGFNGTAVGSPQVWTYTYNNAGQVLTEDGPRTDVSDVSTYTYDASGNLATITNAVGHVTTYSDYDSAGNVGRITAPGGKVTTFSYTSRGKLGGTVSTVDGISSSTAFEYDLVGNVTKVTMPDASTLAYTYDTAQRLTSITDNLGNQVSYTLDLTGNRISETVADPDGTLTRKITRIFDTMNRVQEVTGGAK